ncbi:hypothetical protein Celaphus_00008322 [Cervus elaphus hippelaphus]|uniref:Uncharacterized protein n=1 Tax=Cervus elaphus hippelaphus TaxID=46360 RepID=A0A212CPZ9_CEREH|nr:hypothetical protein Celaphus_00008322 [Cervus elaphus hippelaphus]
MVRTSGEEDWQVPICRTCERQRADAQGDNCFLWSSVSAKIKGTRHAETEVQGRTKPKKNNIPFSKNIRWAFLGGNEHSVTDGIVTETPGCSLYTCREVCFAGPMATAKKGHTVTTSTRKQRHSLSTQGRVGIGHNATVNPASASRILCKGAEEAVMIPELRTVRHLSLQPQSAIKSRVPTSVTAFYPKFTQIKRLLYIDFYKTSEEAELGLQGGWDKQGWFTGPSGMETGERIPVILKDNHSRRPPGPEFIRQPHICNQLTENWHKDKKNIIDSNLWPSNQERTCEDIKSPALVGNEEHYLEQPTAGNECPQDRGGRGWLPHCEQGTHLTLLSAASTVPISSKSHRVYDRIIDANPAGKAPSGTLSIKMAAKGAQSSVKDAVWEDCLPQGD